jgi:hypothetical protein
MLSSIFEALRDGAKADAEEAESLRPEYSRTAFPFNESNNRRFSIMRIEDTISQIPSCTVAFELAGNEIVISELTKSDSQVIFRAGITLNDEGRCKLTLKERPGSEFENWQVRRMALEKLFFG